MSARRSSLRDRISRLRYPLPGPRIDLARPEPSQTSAFVRLLNEPSVARWTLHMPFPYARKDAQDWLKRARNLRRSGGSLPTTIVRRSDGTVLGGAGLHRIDSEGARAEVGYWLGREYRGCGYATEAVNVLLTVGFTRLGLHRIEARILSGNSASIGVVRRCGFRYEGRLRDEVRKDGEWRASLLYSRLANDPPVRKKFLDRATASSRRTP